MNKFWISLLFTIGSGAWIYTKLQKYSGNNTKQSLAGVGIIGLIIFIILFLVLGMVIN